MADDRRTSKPTFTISSSGELKYKVTMNKYKISKIVFLSNLIRGSSVAVWSCLGCWEWFGYFMVVQSNLMEC